MQIFALRGTRLVKKRPTSFISVSKRSVILAMKLIAFFMLAASLQVSATGFSQKITLRKNNVSPERIFEAIHHQTGYVFFYNQREIEKAGTLSLNVKDAALDQVLSLCFKQIPFSYEIVGKTIVLKLKNTSQGGTIPDRPPVMQPQQIHGAVRLDDGTPVAGADVRLIDLSQDGKTMAATMTGADGNYTLTLGHYSKTARLVIRVSAVTIIPLQKPLSLSATSSELNFTVQSKSHELMDAVINAGYYKTSKRLSTGSIAKVSAADIEKQPVSNPLLALSGRVSGLEITQASGIPGSGVQVRLRGQNSLRATANEPLYIVDGVPFSSNLLKADGASIFGYMMDGQGRGGQSPFSALNPADIESIEVLKDADATAIYGSRGANGVILITTKRGKAGRTRTSLNAYTGFGKVAHFLDVLNTRDYLDMRYEAFRNDGVDIHSSSIIAPDLQQWDTTRFTDWQDKLIGKTAKFTDIQSSVSGGNDQTTFLIGAGYRRESTVFPLAFADQKISVHSNISHRSINRKLDIQLTSSYVYDDNRLPSDDLTVDAISLPPVAPALYDANHHLNWENSTWTNPLAEFQNTYAGTISNLIASLRVKYQFSKVISMTLNGQYNTLNFVGDTHLPYSGKDPAMVSPNSQYARSVYYTTNNTNTWNVEPIIEAKFKAGPGDLQILLGTTFQRTYNKANTTQAFGFLDDALLKDLSAGTLFRLSTANTSKYLYNAGFGRINYNLFDKYILNATARRDGSSRFGPGRQFGNFGALGGAWLFSNENFFRPLRSWFNFAKLRASYGLIGSDNIANYGYISNYSAVDIFSNIVYDNVSGLSPKNHANPDFGWESTKKLDIALELAFLDDKLSLDLDYFHDETSNQLVGYALPYITGFSSVQYNLPATVRNTGLELNLSSSNIAKKNFSWKTMFNITFPKNTLVSYPDLENSSYKYNYAIGQPLTIFKGFDLDHIDPKTGLNVYNDANGKPTTSTTQLVNDMVIDLSKQYYGGLGNTLTYKNFSLDIFFQFVKQNGHLQKPPFPGLDIANIPQYLWDNHWQKPGDTNGPKLTGTRGATYFNASMGYDRSFFGDASFIRLKNLSLSYSLKKLVARKNGIQDLKVYMSCQNLLTITGYDGLDPESGATSSPTIDVVGLPPLRVVTFGIQMAL